MRNEVQNSLSLSEEIAERFITPILRSMQADLKEKFGASYRDIFCNFVLASSREKNLSAFVNKICTMVGVSVNTLPSALLEFIKDYEEQDQLIMSHIRENMSIIIMFTNKKNK